MRYHDNLVNENILLLKYWSDKAGQFMYDLYRTYNADIYIIEYEAEKHFFKPTTYHEVHKKVAPDIVYKWVSCGGIEWAKGIAKHYKIKVPKEVSNIDDMASRYIPKPNSGETVKKGV